MHTRSLILVLWLLFMPTGKAATLLVANKSEASVSLLRIPGFEEVAKLKTGPGPHEVAVSPDGSRALVSNYGLRGQPGNTLSLVDIPAAAVLATIELPSGARPHGVEWLDASHAAVTAEGLRRLLIVNTDQRQVTRSIVIDQDIAHMLAVDPGAGRAYTANIGSGSATVIDLEAGRKLRDLATGDGAEGITLAGQELWITNRGADTVSVIDTTSLTIRATLPMTGFPIRAEADSARQRVYITLPRADALAAISTDQRAEVARINFDIGPDRERKTLFGDAMPDSSIPIGVLLSGDGKHLFVAHTNAHVISVYDAQSLQRLRLVPVGLEPDGMAWSARDVAVEAQGNRAER